MCSLPFAVGGRAELVREVNTTFRRQRQSIVDGARRESKSSNSRFDATTDALTVRRSLSLTVECCETVAAEAWDRSALSHVREARVKIRNHRVARHGCFTKVQSKNQAHG